MDRRAGLDQQLTSQTSSVDRSRRDGGFALIEVVCAIAIIALLAAIVLPAIPRATLRARLESYAIQAAAILKADRAAALRRRIRIGTLIDAPSRQIRSGSTGQLVRLPDDVVITALLPTRCGDRQAGQTIEFFASGLSCGGVVALRRPGSGYDIRVNWLTGGVDVVSINSL